MALLPFPRPPLRALAGEPITTLQQAAWVLWDADRLAKEGSIPDATAALQSIATFSPDFSLKFPYNPATRDGFPISTWGQFDNSALPFLAQLYFAQGNYRGAVWAWETYFPIAEPGFFVSAVPSGPNLFKEARKRLVAAGKDLPPPAVFIGHKFLPGHRSWTRGTTVVELRRFCEEVGARLTWDQAAQSATATVGDKSVTFALGSEIAVSGQWSVASPTTNNQKLIAEQLPLGVAPYLNKEGLMMVPLRPLVQALRGTVKWDPETQIVYVNLPAAAGGGS